MITKTRKAIAASGTTIENEPIIKSDGASSDVMQWLSNNESSNITISEDGSNNLDLVVSAGTVTAAALDGTLGATTPATVAATTITASDANATAYSSPYTSGRVPAGPVITVNNPNGTAGNASFLDLVAQGQHSWIGSVAGTSYTPTMVFGLSTAAAQATEYARLTSTGLEVTGEISSNQSGSATVLDLQRDAAANGRLRLDFSNAESNINSLNRIRFTTYGVETVSIDSAGLVVTGAVTATTLSTFANGINLGNVASATATTLDGYKEGTFTVTYGGTTASAVGNSTGIYVRIGGLVWFSYYNNGATFASSSGTASLLGLPFTCANDDDSNYTAFTYQFGNAVDGNSRGGYIGRNTTAMYFTDDGSLTGATYVDGSGKKIMVSGCYQTNDAF